MPPMYPVRLGFGLVLVPMRSVNKKLVTSQNPCAFSAMMIH
jgi:hypothetical protein